MKTLDELAEDAIESVESGYYDASDINDLLSKVHLTTRIGKRLSDAITENRGRALICEVKFSSPSAGEIRNKDSATKIAREMEAGGAVGLSVLTESKNFNGSIADFLLVRKVTSLPMIMKDIIVSEEQIIAAKHMGASAVLFIEEIFSDNLTKAELSLDDAIRFSHELGIETIIETHTGEGLRKIAKTNCDIIGINNRNLRTFETDINTTAQLLKDFTPTNSIRMAPPLIMSESGYETPDDLKRIRNLLLEDKSPTPDAFLIGTSIMRSEKIQTKVRGFVEALSTT
ncbi:MAG: indole-3-glycerol-phosphate synthase [Nitrososphaerota archaeon]|nr:indole-3-glycerol-phosphate synthase [Nitrososphaerota archaeon]